MSTESLLNKTEAAGQEGLAARLKHSLVKMAGDRVKDIVVSVDDERIVIQGRARTFYCLQLVLSSIRGALRETGEHVASIELVTDNLAERGTFQAVCRRSRDVPCPEEPLWQLIA